MDYFKTGLFEDFLESIDQVGFQARAQSSPSASLKWLVLAVHSATQGAMVLALYQGNGFNASRDEDVARWLDAYRSAKSGELPRLPQLRLARFLELYDRVKTVDRMEWVIGGTAFVPTDHDQYIKMLNHDRNSFVHFRLGAWAIDRARVADYAARAVDLIQFLVSSFGFPWYLRSTETLHSEKQRVDAQLRDLSAWSDGALTP